MKIAVVGCGAVGSFYGAKLARAGHEVHFLLRSDFAVVRRKGVLIRSPEGDFRVKPKCAKTPEQIGRSDLVLIALKSTANGAFPNLLPPLVDEKSALLTLQNGLGNEERLAELFSPQQIMGGLCFVCLNRLKPGLIHHIAHGMVVMGEFNGRPKPRTRQLAAAFRDAGIPCKITANLERAHWEKLVWNIPFNGLGVAGVVGYNALQVGRVPPGGTRRTAKCLTTEKLLSDSAWDALVKKLMLEVIAVAKGLKLKIPTSLAAQQIERTRNMGAYKASTLVDFERGLPLELESLFLEPLRRARQAKVTTPMLERLCQVLCKLDARLPRGT
jgi:2-dehydropantoate 2-reductase